MEIIKKIADRWRLCCRLLGYLNPFNGRFPKTVDLKTLATKVAIIRGRGTSCVIFMGQIRRGGRKLHTHKNYALPVIYFVCGELCVVVVVQCRRLALLLEQN